MAKISKKKIESENDAKEMKRFFGIVAVIAVVLMVVLYFIMNR